MGDPLNALAFTSMFVLALVVSAGLRAWLAMRQIRHVASHRDVVPPAFADRIGLAAHQRAAAYTIARTRLGLVDHLVATGFVVVLVLLGGLQWVHDIVGNLFGGQPMVGQVAFVLAVTLLTSVVELPV